jgi:hypothetical protein
MTFAGYHPDIDPAYLAPNDWRGTVRSNAARLTAAKIDTLPDVDDGLEQSTMEVPEPESQHVDANAHVRSEVEHSRSPHCSNIRSTHRIDPNDDRRPLKLKDAKPTYIKRVVDANDRQRTYYYRGGKPMIRLTGEHGSAEFRASYDAAIQTKAMLYRLAQRPPTPARSFNRLVERYVLSADFQQLLPQTQKVYRRVVDRLMHNGDLGTMRVADLTPTNVRRLVSNQHTPAAANDLLKKLRILMRFAVELKWRPDDPTSNPTMRPTQRMAVRQIIGHRNAKQSTHKTSSSASSD